MVTKLQHIETINYSRSRKNWPEKFGNVKNIQIFSKLADLSHPIYFFNYFKLS